MGVREQRAVMQPAFDKIWDWFVVQKKPRSTSDHACAYRGANGARCPVGLLLPDSEYKSDFEGDSVKFVRRHTHALRQYPLKFLEALQSSHDEANPAMFAREFQDRLREIAAEFKLTVPA